MILLIPMALILGFCIYDEIRTAHARRERHRILSDLYGFQRRLYAVADKRLERIRAGQYPGPELTEDNLAEAEAFFEERKPTP